MLCSVVFSSFVAGALATQGFNYGAVKIDGSIKVESDFRSEFSTAKSLSGTNGAFSSARLYTTIQAGSKSDPISAIPAAIAEGTTLLLGIWASAGQETIDNEIAALKGAISAYGDSFASLVTGLSVGNEDLYRITPTGLANDPNSVGAGPDVLVNYINQVRAAVKGTGLEKVPIGHVDTWTAWVNGSNSAVADAVDFLGMNTFPYYQTTDSNAIGSGKSLFQAAYDATVGAGKGKPVWVTETGWPVVGKQSGQAEASTQNAKTYWDDVGCGLFGKTNTWWYTLVDANTDPTQPEFGIVGTTLSSKPLYDLSCDGVAAVSSSMPSTQVSTPSPNAPSPSISSPPAPPPLLSPSLSPSPETTPEPTSSTEVSSPAPVAPTPTSSSIPDGTTVAPSPSLTPQTEIFSPQDTASSSSSYSSSTSTSPSSSTTPTENSTESSPPQSSSTAIGADGSAGTSASTSSATGGSSGSGSGSSGSSGSSASGSSASGTKAGSSSSTSASASAKTSGNAGSVLAPASVMSGLVGALSALLAAL